ncbi:hypothetical protein FRC08_000395 [Ceratobasidium sp. 394]|nr:hypothetical protein FRC08_000395 [Ceratobasidium sp. 394]
MWPCISKGQTVFATVSFFFLPFLFFPAHLPQSANGKLCRILDDRDDRHEIQRYCAGRVRAFLKLPGHLRSYYSGHPAFVEIFPPFEALVSPFTRMHSTQPEYDSRGWRRARVLPVDEIVLACHLAPKFNKLDRDLKPNARTDLFAISKRFWLNYYCNGYTSLVQQHWRSCRPTRMQRLICLVR